MEDDGDDKDDTKRRTRNLSEKKRRDQFNTLVTELSTLISSNSRKMDKSTVLKSTISFLKNHNEVTVRSRAHDVQEDWKPAFLSNEEFHYLVMEALEGFMMVLSTDGKIYYVSETITSLLGHNPGDIVNKTIFDLTFEEDRPNLFNLLQTNATVAKDMNPSKENEMIRFQIHLRRGILDFREEVSYDLVQFYGHFRENQELLEDNHDLMNYQQDSDSRGLFVCIGRLHTPQLIHDVSLVDPSRSEFTSRHSLEWKFLFLDHRAPPIIGYLPFEVLGTSGYDYYHFDDLEKVVTCHEALMQKGELTSCYYRFLTKGQQWIWLQTRYYITYHQWNSKPEFVVCTHRVVSYADVSKVAKEEGVEQDIEVCEAEDNLTVMKEAPDEAMPSISPSYMPDAASEDYHNPYQPIAQEVTKLLIPTIVIPLSPSYTAMAATDGFGNTFQMVSQDTLNVPPPGDPRLLPSFGSDRSDSFANAYPPISQNLLSTPVPSEDLSSMSPLMSEHSDSLANSLSSNSKNKSVSAAGVAGPSTRTRKHNEDNHIEGPPSVEAVATASPIYVPEASNALGALYRPYSKPALVKTVSATCTAGTMAVAATVESRSRSQTRYAASDGGSVSGESHTSQQNNEREPPKQGESLMPMHGVGAQYLDPQVYGTIAARGMSPHVALPGLVTSDHAQIQEQLQRKHEELQQMIVHQQEELRRVKEQLLLARLGILQPLISVPSSYPTPEDIQNQQRVSQLAYLNPPRLPIGYPHVAMPPMQPHTPLSPHPPHLPHTPQPPHPPHPSDHQHMP